MSRGRSPLLAVRWLRGTLALLGVAMTFAGAAAKSAAPSPEAALPPVEVKDLAYGDVLFHFYQDDYFGALTRLTVAQERGTMPHHSDDAELLSGGLYLSLGQHREAGEIFERVLDRKNVPPAVRDRARFYLGKVWYQRGYMDKAVAVLGQAGNRTLPANMEAERRLLLAEALLSQGRYDEAVSVLRGWQGPRTWMAYAQFNLGVALIRSGHLDDGIHELDVLGKSSIPGNEGTALRDKANLAMGYALLQANRATEAEEALERVRLEGPMSTRALLGVGWAESANGQFKDALGPWLELRGRNLLDPAVQESYLAVPYAYAKLGANAQAAENYESAVREFEGETARIDESIEAIRGGKLLDAIIKHDVKGDMGWSWQLANLPDAPESRYLYHLLARNEFQEGLKNYRQLLFMQRNLDVWSENLDAYDTMITTRQHRYETQVPAARAKLAQTDLESLRRRRTDIEARLTAAESSGDVVALATAHEHENYDKVTQLEALAADSTDDDAEESREKLHMIKGVIYWQMHAGFKARAWAVRKNVREVQQALRETESRWSLVKEAADNVPARDGEFAARVAALGPRLGAAQSEVDRLKAAEGGYLSELAISELRSQRSRLASYLIQARYALATLYDRAADDSAPKRPAKPAEPGPDEQPEPQP